MTDDLVLIQTDDPAITTITLNRPAKRNALSLALIDALREAIATTSADPARRALILRANGPSFCAGLDLAEADEPGMHERSAAALAAMYEAPGTSPPVPIAAPRGAAT